MPRIAEHTHSTDLRQSEEVETLKYGFRVPRNHLAQSTDASSIQSMLQQDSSHTRYKIASINQSQIHRPMNQQHELIAIALNQNKIKPQQNNSKFDPSNLVQKSL